MTFRSHGGAGCLTPGHFRRKLALSTILAGWRHRNAEDVLPLLDEIRRQRVLLYGKDPFAEEDAEDTLTRIRAMVAKIEALTGQGM